MEIIKVKENVFTISGEYQKSFITGKDIVVDGEVYSNKKIVYETAHTDDIFNKYKDIDLSKLYYQGGWWYCSIKDGISISKYDDFNFLGIETFYIMECCLLNNYILSGDVYSQNKAVNLICNLWSQYLYKSTKLDHNYICSPFGRNIGNCIDRKEFYNGKEISINVNGLCIISLTYKECLIYNIDNSMIVDSIHYMFKDEFKTMFPKINEKFTDQQKTEKLINYINQK